MNLINREEQDKANQQIEKVLDKYALDEQIIILQDCLNRKGRQVKKQEAEDYKNETFSKLPDSIKNMLSIGKEREE